MSAGRTASGVLAGGAWIALLLVSTVSSFPPAVAAAALPTSTAPVSHEAVAGGAAIAAVGAATEPGASLEAGPSTPSAVATPGAGCFDQPMAARGWNRGLCEAASNGPLAVGNGKDWVGTAPFGEPIGFASGGFTSVSGVTGEVDNQTGAGAYSLQLNSQTYTCDTPYTDSRQVLNGCWDQFVVQVTSREVTVFIEYWVVGYYNAYRTCPSTPVPGSVGWGQYQGSCYANSASTLLLLNGTPVTEPVTNLANLTLSGSIYTTNGTTYDEAIVTDRAAGPSGTSWSATVPDDPLALTGNWLSVEFNVLGFGSRSEARFNTGTSIAVSTAIEALNGTPLAQRCLATGFSAETSNLSLGSCSTFPPNHLTYTEVNAPPTYRRASFTERLLPPGTTWWLNITGGPSVTSAGSIVNLWLPRGNYTFSATSANHDYAHVVGFFHLGAFAIARGVRFTLTVYRVTFTDSGLPRGAQWCVTILGGKRYCTTTISRGFPEPNATYNYTISTPRPGFSAPPGTFTVSGAPLSVNVTFT